jgi:hypothetical protein
LQEERRSGMVAAAPLLYLRFIWRYTPTFMGIDYERWDRF